MDIIRSAAMPYDPERIAIQIMTRGHPEKFKTAITSLEGTVTDFTRICLWVYVDLDDETARDLIEHYRINPPAIPINWILGPRTTSMGATCNFIYSQARESSGLFFGFPDDFRITSEHWDEEIRTVFRAHPDRLVLAYLKDQEHNDIAKMMALSREWVDTLGYFFPAYFPYWFGDLWIDQISQAMGRKVQLKMTVADVGGSRGRTQRMWNLPFWSRFFTACAPQRWQDVERLYTAMATTTPDVLEALRAQRTHWLQKFRVELNNVGVLSPRQLVEVEWAQTREDSAIPLVYLKAEAEAVQHLVKTGQHFGRTFKIPPTIPAGGVTAGLQAEVVQALMAGASFIEIGAHTPEQASRALEWRNTYVQGLAAR